MSLFMLFSLNSFADVVVEIGGVRHQCTPMSADGNPVSCADRAYRGPFSREESMALCVGAFNEAPADCAIEAYKGVFSKTESLALCKGATTTGPYLCANLAYRGPFSKEETLRLCSNNASEATATCAIKAYRGPYSKEEAIKMCKRPGSFTDKSLISERTYSKEEINQMVKEANIKAVELKEYK